MQESSSGEIHIDAPTEHVRLLLDYVHGSMAAVAPQAAKPLFQLADQYGIAGLAAACEARLTHGLSVEAVPELLDLCDAHCCDSLMQACLAFVQSQRCAEWPVCEIRAVPWYWSYNGVEGGCHALSGARAPRHWLCRSFVTSPAGQMDAE
jgi:hypothetical protein